MTSNDVYFRFSLNRAPVYFILATFMLVGTGNSEALAEHSLKATMVEHRDGNKFNFEVTHVSPSPSQRKTYRIEGSCNELKREMNIIGHQNLSVHSDYFADGLLRQNVVFLDKVEVARIKLQRDMCSDGTMCGAARLQLTDPSDRISSDITHGENDSLKITARNHRSKVVLTAKKEKATWELSTEEIELDIAALLLASARMEQFSCVQAPLPQSLTRYAIFGAMVAILMGGIYINFR